MNSYKFSVQRWTRVLAVCCFVAIASVSLSRADLVTDWNRAMTDYATPRSPVPLPPFLEVRVYAMAHLAMYQALDVCSRQKYASLINASAAAAKAAHDVVVHEFADGAPAFDLLLANQLAAWPDSPAKSKGLAVGATIAAQIIAQRAHDGAATSEGPYAPGKKPGNYQFTPPFDGPPFNGYAQGVNWGKVKPFTLRRGNQLRPPAPYTLDDLEYTFDVAEIKTLGALNSTSRSPDETAVAFFWFESSGLGWNRIARLLADQQPNALVEHARLFALLNIAMTDATIAAFDAKYAYNFWRPITAIRQAADDGNASTEADPTWDSLMTAPPVPDYPSNHSAMGGSAAAVLISFYGDKRELALESSSLPGVRRTFQFISDAAKENANSRMLAGIHFRLACSVGLDLGGDVAHWALKHPHLRYDGGDD